MERRAALVAAGFVEPVMDVEHLTLEYREAKDLVADLRALGERNFSAARRRTLTGKGKLAGFVEAYEQFRRDGALPATFEVIYGVAWASPHAPDSAPVPNGLASVPVETLRRQLKQRQK